MNAINPEKEEVPPVESRTGDFEPTDKRQTFPLAALVGQEQIKLALLLLAVDPDLGGVLISGQKGTAKSTAVRALAELLPPMEAVVDCPYNCPPAQTKDQCPDCRRKSAGGRFPPSRLRATPFLTLPLGATEDRVVGGLDIEPSARTGRPHLTPGLLGQANRGYLYVDEVNLLEPYLAHLLLDAVASRRLLVEREGLSLWHPSAVALIGTMNPEEGPLGPQLGDRFALRVEVAAETDLTARKEIIRRRLAFEADPDAFRRQWAGQSLALAGRIAAARRVLPQVKLNPSADDLIASLVREARPQGHRADLALARAARALAAWEGYPAAEEAQVLAVAGLVMTGRVRRKKENTRAVKPEIIVPAAGDRHFEAPFLGPARGQKHPSAASAGRTEPPPVEKLFAPNPTYDLTTPTHLQEKGPRGRSGRRTNRQTDQARGRYYRSSCERLGRPVALDATLRAAAPHQTSRRADEAKAFIIREPDLREKAFRQKTGRLILFVVDASGSVGSLRRMPEAKAAALSLLNEAYQKRDKVGLVAFNGLEAEVILPPTNSVEMANRRLSDLPTGGKTPLASALVLTHRLVRTALSRDPALTPWIIIMTDGRPNIPLEPGANPWREALRLAGRLAQDHRLRFLLVDTDHGHYNDYKMTKDLAEALRAPRLTLEELRRNGLDAWF
ncbi:MAG: VWA domain-containing protein [Thermodesulfobacteriota bacterium]